MKRYLWLGLFVLIAGSAACKKPLASAGVLREETYLSRDFAAAANDIYYAARFSLDRCGYSIATENLQDGVLTTTWMPVTSDSHYVEIFGRPDYGVTNSYHRLDILVEPEGGRTRVKVGSKIKSLVSHLKSSGIEERKVLEGIANFLRKGDPEITNLGVSE